MHPFEETISVAGAIAAAGVATIIVLTLFYRALSWVSGAGSKPETVAVRGVLKKNTFATVHMAGGDTFEQVRFVGFTNSQTLKTHLPYELNGMVILEDEQKQRYLVRARDIRKIVIAPDAETS
jgi:hypothetical protein